MKLNKTLIIAALLTGLSATAQAESFGKPCTTEPKEKWLSLEAIEKVVKDHGFDVAKSKGTCVEVYVRDENGKRIELFIDPATGNPVGSDWKS